MVYESFYYFYADLLAGDQILNGTSHFLIFNHFPCASRVRMQLCGREMLISLKFYKKHMKLLEILRLSKLVRPCQCYIAFIETARLQQF